jgi:hypothetical protein
VLCETVIMHLPPAEVAPATARLLAILKPAGTLYLSWRVNETERRDAHGRLYAAFDKTVVVEALAGAEIMLDETALSVSSGNIIERVVARKRA